MAPPADTILVDGEIRVRPGTGRTVEALAVRDGRVCRIGDTYEVEFLAGIGTRRVDLDGRTVVPGFVDGDARLTAPGGEQGSDAAGAGAPGSRDRGRETLIETLESARERGLTTVHDAVGRPDTARAYHELARGEDLPVRVRLTYGVDSWPTDGPTPLDALEALGLASGVGTGRLQVNGIGIEVDDLETPALRAILRQAATAGFPVAATAVDGDALDTLLSALDALDGTGLRVRLEAAPTEAQLRALAAADVTVVGRPGASAGGGEGDQPAERGAGSNALRFGPLLGAGLSVAFGSASARPDPLRDVERAVGAGGAASLDVSGAMRIATGAGTLRPQADATAGSLAVGVPADFAVLSASPWKSSFDQVAVDVTAVGGTLSGEAL